ncbi:lamin tail domain-containing protein [Tolypothrix sp. FACHB-123]|nr:lamin tail domain-containing protein [Tolypothrix sp. FACHB-123]
MATGDVFISQILYKGKIKRTQDDEYIEITNKGTTPADLSGWRVTSAGSNKQVFTFSKGTLLQPGKSFRVYSNQVHPESGGFSFGSSTALWKDSGDEGKLFDAQGNNVSTWAYGTNSIAGIKAELGVPQLVVEASPSAIIRQTALGGKVTFTEALKLALRSFLEDENDIGSPLSLMLGNPGGYDGLPPNADKATTMEVLRSYVNQPNAKIILYSAKRGHELEGGETTETSWIFELIADQINSEQHWAIVDRAGEKAPYNYCVG